MKWSGAAGAVAVLLCAVTSRAAAPCVATTLQPGLLDARGRARLAEQLSASLAQHDIATCRGQGESAETLAEVIFEAPEGARASIRVRDVVTRKEVVRVVRIGAVPADGRPLALALAADELLRASWAEILLARAPAPPPEPPPQVRAVVEASLATAPTPTAGPAPAEPGPEPARPDTSLPPRVDAGRSFTLGAALAGEHAAGGLTLGGLDARFAVYPIDRLALTARLGARAALASTSADGSATATAFVGGAGLSIALLPRRGVLGVELPIRADVEDLLFSAHPLPGAHGADGSAIGVSATAGLAATVRFARTWLLDVEAVGGVVLRDVSAQDGGAGLTAWSGGVVGAAVGVRGEI